MVIRPLIDGNGRMVSLANQVLKKSVKANRIVHFEGVAEFDERFLVTAPDELGKTAIQAALTPTVRRQMSSLHYLMIHAGGDVLSIANSLVSGGTNLEKTEMIDLEVSQVCLLFRGLCVARDSLMN
jgi:hypothetical protein